MHFEPLEITSRKSSCSVMKQPHFHKHQENRLHLEALYKVHITSSWTLTTTPIPEHLFTKADLANSPWKQKSNNTSSTTKTQGPVSFREIASLCTLTAKVARNKQTEGKKPLKIHSIVHWFKRHSPGSPFPRSDVSSSNTREDSACPSWRISRRCAVIMRGVRRKGRGADVTENVSAEGEMADEGGGGDFI